MILKRALAWLLLFGFLAVAPAAAAFKYVEVGQVAPTFVLETLDGQRVDMAEAVGTKALAVVFWATWSPRSVTLLGEIEKIRQQYGAQGFEALAVEVDHEDLDAETRAKAEKLAAGWSFPVLVDKGLQTFQQYGVVATPSLALVDEAGVVRYGWASYSTSARLEIEEAVQVLLGIVPEKAEAVAARTRVYVPPKKATLHYQKAQVLIRRKMAKKAVRDLDKAAKLDPQWAEPRVLLARIYLNEARKKHGALDKAEAALREAREIQPEHLQTLALLADVLVAKKHFEEALTMADEALGMEPAYTPALLARARSLRALDRLDEAEVALKEALDNDPRNPETLAETGELAASRGQWEAAAEAFRQAVERALATVESGS